MFKLFCTSTSVLGLALLFYLQLGGKLPSVALPLSTPSLPTVSETAPPKIEVRSVALQRIQESADLTTAKFTMEAITPVSQDQKVLGMSVGSTKLLYITRATISAGVDLSNIKPDQIQETTDKVTITLPPAKITGKELDTDRSTTYSYDKGLTGPDTAPDLIKQAQSQGLKEITNTACRDGILTKATGTTEKIVKSILEPLAQGKTVEVKIASPTACN